MYALILAHDLDKKGEILEMSPLTKSRVDLGIDLLKKGKVSKLIMSGGCDHLYGITLAKVMAEYALSKGLTKDQVLEESISRDTAGQLFFVKEGILKPKVIKDILIITNPYHIKRTKEEASLIFGENYNIEFAEAIGEDRRKSGKELEINSINAFRKTFEDIPKGLDKAMIDRLFSEKHPCYYKEKNYFLNKLKELKEKSSRV